jgi:crossover junction endodeoxyribonuclease RuvC
VSDRVIVLGIDPGTITTGFGVVAFENGRMRAVSWSRLTNPAAAPLAERLSRIHAEVARQIEAHRPDEVAVEDVFQAKNVRSALKLGHARGVALLAAAEAGLPIFEYAPREVKLSVVGVGSATKAQVSSMVRRLLDMGSDRLREDESDAVAVAICHIHKRGRTDRR